MKLIGKIVMVLALAALLMPGAARAAGVDLGHAFDRVVVNSSDRSLISVKFEEPAEKQETPKEKKHANLDLKGWGGFGGPMVQWLNFDLQVLDPMTDKRGLDSFDNDMILVGGLGGGIKNNFRFGGWGAGNGQDVADRVAGHRRSAKMTMGGGGFFLEYNPALSSSVGLALGAMLGAGGIQLEASGPDLGPKGEWDADGAFAMAYPYAGLWVAPVKWMWVELDAGYLYFKMDTSGSGFDNDLGKDMVEDDITGGFQAALKVNFGYNPKAEQEF